MKEPEIVPDKIRSRLDYRALIGIALLVVLFHVLINYIIGTDDADTIASIFSFFNPLVVASVGFIVAVRYRKSLVFGKSYTALAIGYLSIFFGEVTYMLYDIVYNIEPYPSIADVFFFIQYPLLLVHLILNIKFFAQKINKISKIWIIIMPIIILLGYSILSTTEDGIEIFEFDFYYGIVFIYFSALTLSFAVIGAMIFKEGAIGKAWVLLVIGILFNTMGDTWYYNLELFEAYDLVHPVNMFWYAGYWLVIYALIKLKQVV
ncbi:MAG: histidine kinase [Nitrosopumilus sp.]|nr:histidine kinase [Nitrosopumilus sp.]MDH3736378.1 histidine kinase [Nitrosopumilus sp.]MDH3823887.1 histidine kinase [Nitrosopumilus sp.]MDH3833435.1 histidine kinase [Nitrosopumilus sp.]